MSVITCHKLRKVYGQTAAVDGLDLAVEAGEMFGFLGPNGAGKTTTIRIMTTLSKPTSGTVTVGGYDVVREPDKVRKSFGIVQQHLSLDKELTVVENLEVHGRLHGLPAGERRQRIAELLDYVELSVQVDQLVGALSGGMKRRAMIARALLHRPRVIFLDEPTVGLDPQGRRRIWELVRRMNADGSTVFLTTHYIEEAEALCGRVGIIHQGRFIALGAPEELKRRLGQVAVEALVDGTTNYRYFADRAAAHAYAQ
ncbi:MAG: ABC transporter ATP-binding protein, partial [Chloroflexota bacterium]